MSKQYDPNSPELTEAFASIDPTQMRIARDMLDGKLWLPQIAKSTHYHAYWVHPSWVHEMRKIGKIGVHTFYRPRAWGDGSDEPSWSDRATTARETKIIKKMQIPGDSNQ